MVRVKSERVPEKAYTLAQNKLHHSFGLFRIYFGLVLVIMQIAEFALNHLDP